MKRIAPAVATVLALSVSGDLFQQFTYYYSPTSSGQVLTITFTGPGAESVVAPEPSTIIGSGLCGLMIAGLAWRHRATSRRAGSSATASLDESQAASNS